MHKNIFQYSRTEELINSLTHAFGALLSIYFLVSLISAANNDIPRIITSWIFAGSLFVMFTSSTFYHNAKTKKRKIFLKRIDHICIYIVIAGGYTPYIVHHFDPNWTSVLLAIVWSIAGLGVLYKMFTKSKNIFFSIGTYICFGLIFFAMKIFIKMNMNDQVFNWLLISGAFYIFGAGIYAMKKIPHHHGLWHLFVLAGSSGTYISLMHGI